MKKNKSLTFSGVTLSEHAKRVLISLGIHCAACGLEDYRTPESALEEGAAFAASGGVFRHRNGYGWLSPVPAFDAYMMVFSTNTDDPVVAVARWQNPLYLIQEDEV